MRKTQLFLLSGVLGLAGLGASLSATKNVTVVEVPKCAVGGETLLIEAENGLVTGEPHVAGENFVEVGKTSDNSEHPTSGGNSVGYWATQGNKITFTVKADAAVSGATMNWWMCNGDTSARQLDASLKVTVNGTKVNWAANASIPGRSGNQWAYWRNIAMGEAVNFAAGKNTIVIENLNGINAAFDCLNIVLPAGASQVVEVPPDVAAPVISNLVVNGEKALNKEQTISFDVTDNESAADKITTEIKVTVKPAGAQTKAVTVTDKKFTIAEAGKYIVSVNATDEAGNKSEDVKVEFEIAGAPAGDKGSKPTAKPTRQWEEKDTGYVIFGITMGLSVLLIATMVVLTVLKKKGKKE